MRNRVTDRTRYLYHVTHKANWFSVGTQGLLEMYAGNGGRGIFLVSKSRLDWAFEHISKRLGVPKFDLVVVKVRVRRSRLTPVRFRSVKRGMWKHTGDIYPVRIEWIDTYPTPTRPGRLPAGVTPSQDDGNAAVTW
jgi:hypothetical protein